MVKKQALKDRKGGKVKGKGKGRKPRTCFECGAADHIAAACPQRAARVAAGGPERLDKADDFVGASKGGGKKGGKTSKGEQGKREQVEKPTRKSKKAKGKGNTSKP